MITRKKINAYEVGLVFENDRLKRVLTEGKYFIKLKETLWVKSTLAPFFSKMDLSILLENEELKSMLNVVEVKDNELAIVYKTGKFESVLTSGTYAYWKKPISYDFKLYNLDQNEVPKDVSKSILKSPYLRNFVRIQEVLSYEKGLLYIDDKLEKELLPGVYFYWQNANKIEVKKVDMRLQNIELLGQEILTSDKANIRVNFSASYQVVDINKAIIENKDYIKQLYTVLQMSLRTYIGNKSLDEILSSKDKVGDIILKEIDQDADKLGLKIIQAGIKDIILPGDMKEIMNQVLIAQKKAQANVITRREETASTRSLLNTAKLMEDNEMLYKLKEMEYVEKIADKIGEITVSGNGGIVSQLKEILSGNTKNK